MDGGPAADRYFAFGSKGRRFFKLLLLPERSRSKLQDTSWSRIFRELRQRWRAKTESLITCSEGGGGDPGGPAMAVKNAVEILQPKAVFCIGTCRGLYRDKTKLGDVVVPAKLTTYAPRRMTSIGAVPCGFTTPLSSSMSRLIRQAGFGWKPPLENPEVREVTVHRDSELLSGPGQMESSQRRDEHIRLYPNAIAVELDGDGK